MIPVHSYLMFNLMVLAAIAIPWQPECVIIEAIAMAYIFVSVIDLSVFETAAVGQKDASLSLFLDYFVG